MEQEVKTITPKDFKDRMIKGYIDNLCNLKINELPFCTNIRYKSIKINDSIELEDLNQYLHHLGLSKEYESFLAFITDYYMHELFNLKKEKIPFPDNEKPFVFPALSITPDTTGKIMRIEY